MSKKVKQKFYVVWEGKNPGIYLTWEDCILQIKAYPNAKYKSFESSIEASKAFKSNYREFMNAVKKVQVKSNYSRWQDYVSRNSITVDAACEGNPGNMEYRAVEPYSGKQIFHKGPLKNGTNNIGEFLAIVHGLALLKKMNKADTVIYTDSMTAISWIKKKKPNTKLKFDKTNQEIKDLLERAVQWLNTNTYANPIKKWETEAWGEIPADFGRK